MYSIHAHVHVCYLCLQYTQVLSLKTSEFQKMIQISDQAQQNMTEIICRFVVVGDATKKDFLKDLQKQRQRIIHFATKQVVIVIWFIILFIGPVIFARTVTGMAANIAPVGSISAICRAIVLFLMFDFNDSIYNYCCLCLHRFVILCFDQTHIFDHVDQEIGMTQSSKLSQTESHQEEQVQKKSIVFVSEA